MVKMFILSLLRLVAYFHRIHMYSENNALCDYFRISTNLSLLITINSFILINHAIVCYQYLNGILEVIPTSQHHSQMVNNTIVGPSGG